VLFVPLLLRAEKQKIENHEYKSYRNKAAKSRSIAAGAGAGPRAAHGVRDCCPEHIPSRKNGMRDARADIKRVILIRREPKRQCFSFPMSMRALRFSVKLLTVHLHTGTARSGIRVRFTISFLRFFRLVGSLPEEHRMSFLKTSTSFTRFRITDSVPKTLWAEIPDRLRRNCFTDIDDLPEERSFGWTSFEDMLDTTWRVYPVEKGVYLAFCLRLDTRRVPPAVIKKHLALALKQEEAHNREQGRKFVARERKKEIKEQVLLRLRMRFLPIPAEFQVVWNTAESLVYFASIQQKMLDLFEDLFIRTFELHLVPLSPYELAVVRMQDSTSSMLLQLDTLEPTQFA
jgi:hypothetical protein